jgi:SNF2 family DNA or RNA helicase
VRARAQLIEKFQAGDGDVFLISLKAGGTGINLTAADYVIHLDPWWNPAVEDQATDRAHRIGQSRPVTVMRLVARGTVEERILTMHAEKRALVSGVLDGTDAAAKLSTRDLLALIGEVASA